MSSPIGDLLGALGDRLFYSEQFWALQEHSKFARVNIKCRNAVKSSCGAFASRRQLCEDFVKAVDPAREAPSSAARFQRFVAEMAGANDIQGEEEEDRQKLIVMIIEGVCVAWSAATARAGLSWS